MSSLDYLDLCRLCLVKDGVSVPIFEGETFLKISACLPVKVTREDKLPKKICHDCVCKVELFYDFCNTTANSEKQLLQLLGDVHMEDDKQNYIETVLSPNRMKSDEGGKNNRLEDTVMQQVSEHQNSMNIMDNIMDMPMMISGTTQQQITSVPMDTTGESVQNVPVAGPSTQMTHEQVHINQNQSDTPMQQEEEEESSEEEENFEEECDADEGLPVKEESEEDPNNRRTVEPTTFVNVSLTCEEAGPSGLQQQKIPDIPDTMVLPQTEDVDPKTGLFMLGNVLSSSFAESNNTMSSNITGTVKELRVHLACNICSSLFETSMELKKHMQRHKYKCRLCEESFVMPHLLDNHLILTHGEPKYTCKVCRFIAWTRAGIKEHLVAKHLDPFNRACKVCNREFHTRYGIERHYYRYHSDLTVGCTVCKRTYKNFVKLNTHIKLVHLNTGYECKVCTRQLTSLAFLAAHMRSHEIKQHDKLQTEICTTCGEVFHNRRNLTEHVTLVHGKVDPHVCPVCKKSFNRRANQVQHILTHMTSMYECEVCGMRFARRGNLVTHRKRHPEVSGTMSNIPIRAIVGEFVRNYVNYQKNSQKAGELPIKSEVDSSEVQVIVGE